MVAPSALALFYPTLLTTLMQSNYTVFPDEDGVPHLVKLNDEANFEPNVEGVSLFGPDLNSISFVLYTRNNPYNGRTLQLGDANSVRASSYHSSRPTFFIAHGWRSSGTSKVATLIRDAFLAVSDSNIIVVDWSQIAKNVLYPEVAKHVPKVAQHVASFMNFMRANANMQTSTMKVIGHSLGAHVAGLASRIVSQSSLVAEIVALDPAKPMFEDKGPNGRVDRSQARNVQVIHTCAGMLGMDRAVGTSDFFINGGNHQPGCTDDMFGSCSHGRSYEYFSESIRKPRGFAGSPMHGGVKAYMGGYTLDLKARGSYKVKTASHSPFALGG